MTVAGWLFDLLGIRAVTNALNTVFPQRQTLRFLGGASVVDNAVLGTTDVTPAATSYRWVATDAPAAAADRFPAVPDGIAASSADGLGQFVVTQAFTATYLSFVCLGNALATDTVLVVLRKGGVDTAVTLTIPAGTAPGTIISDSAHSVPFARGDRVSVRLRQSGATARLGWYGLFQVG